MDSRSNEFNNRNSGNNTNDNNPFGGLTFDELLKLNNNDLRDVIDNADSNETDNRG